VISSRWHLVPSDIQSWDEAPVQLHSRETAQWTRRRRRPHSGAPPIDVVQVSPGKTGIGSVIVPVVTTSPAETAVQSNDAQYPQGSIVTNLTVWVDVASLRAFAYKSVHRYFCKALKLVRKSCLAAGCSVVDPRWSFPRPDYGQGEADPASGGWTRSDRLHVSNTV
jgi:hypothetical protein